MWKMGLSSGEVAALWAVLGVAIIGLLYALFLARQILSKDKGTPEMQAVWKDIRDGARAYLNTQLRSLVPLMVLLFILLAISVLVVPVTPEAVETFCAVPEGLGRLEVLQYACPTATWAIALGRAFSFLLGASFSFMVGYLGMMMAVEGNVRVASAARRSYSEALTIAYRSGTITGMLTVGLGLLGGTIIFMVYGKSAPDALLGFGFGGSLIALFMRVGGGIYTKAADVGADLVGKVEAGLEEDDPRNAAVIADLVGDNVGDCAGMAADVFESFEVTIVSALILGIAIAAQTGEVHWILFPLFVRAVGVIASIIGTYLVRTDDEKRDAMGAINFGYYASAVIATIGFGVISWVYMRGEWRLFLATVAGVALAIAIEKLTEIFTGTDHQPVKEIAASTRFGAATTILSGLAEGFESTVWQALAIAASIGVAIFLFHGQPYIYILYAVALTGIGMLTMTGNNVSMDSFGPIADNAGGIAEVAGMSEEGIKVLDDLDAVGNTTKAITKGVAIASAVIAAVSLFGSFFTDTNLVLERLGRPTLAAINVADPLVFIGLLVGGTLPWLFGGLMIRAVSRAAGDMIQEVREQFRWPGVMEGTRKPDYARAVAISTRAAQKELLPLGVMAITTPIIVGLVLKAEALGAFLAGLIVSGQLLAVFMANAGGAWDNAKKTIEDGLYGGKGSEAHKASVVGDTVGDPLKDTSGPAMNPMIKVVNLVALIIAPMVVQFTGLSVGVIVFVLILLAAFIWALRISKRPSGFAEGMSE